MGFLFCFYSRVFFHLTNSVLTVGCLLQHRVSHIMEAIVKNESVRVGRAHINPIKCHPDPWRDILEQRK